MNQRQPSQRLEGALASAVICVIVFLVVVVLTDEEQFPSIASAFWIALPLSLGAGWLFPRAPFALLRWLRLGRW